MTLRRLQRIAIDAVRVSPGGTEKPKTAIGSGTSGMGLHLRGHQLPHRPVAAVVPQLLKLQPGVMRTRKGGRRSRACVEDEEWWRRIPPEVLIR